MSSKLCQTALSYIKAYETLSTETFQSLLAPTAIHTFAPSTVPLPSMTPSSYVNHIKSIKELLASLPVYPKEIFENEEKRQVTIWATSKTIFKDEAKDDGLTDDDWTYQGEYMFIFEMDETREKIVRIIEFMDSKGTERCGELITRAKSNLEKASRARK